MSSPTNIIVVITHLYDRDLFEAIVADVGNEWYASILTDEDGAPDQEGRLYHTDQALNEFFDNASGVSGSEDGPSGFSDGAEGNMFVWGYAGDYINQDRVVDVLEPAIRRLIHEMDYVCATIFFQPDDEVASCVQIDATTPTPRKLGDQKFSFDVDLARVPSGPKKN